MSDTVVKILRPAAFGRATDVSPFQFDPTGDPWDTVDPGDPLVHDGDDSIAFRGSGGNQAEVTMKPDTSFIGTMVAVTAVEVFNHASWDGGTGTQEYYLRIWLDGNVSTSGTKELGNANVYDTASHDFIAARPGGGTWVEVDFRDATFEFGHQNNESPCATSITSMWVEVTYVPGTVLIEAFKDVWSRRLRRSRFPEEVYQVKVPLDFLALELIDEMNLSDQSLPRAASLITDLARDGTIKEWQRLYALNVEQRINLNDMTMVIGCSDLEPYMCIFWSTGKAPFIVNDLVDGIAQTNNGAVLTFTRASSSWISQADGQVVTLTNGHDKTNHIGTILDEARTNLITNSNFQDGLDDWTSVASDGTIAVDTSTLLFANTAAYPNSIKITRGTGETYIHQSITAPGDNGFRTIAIDHRNSSGESSWWLQRSADSLWWNDDDEDWQTARYENILGSYNAANVINERSVSNPIVEATGSDTWTLQIGVGSDPTSATEGTIVYIYQVDCVEGSYIVERLITAGSATFTSDADDMRWTLNLETGFPTPRQTWLVDRGTIRCTYTPNNSASHVQVDDELVLLFGQLGDEATSPTDYDVLLYQNLSGTNPRFAFERYIGGVLAGRATKDHALVRDTPVEIAVRTTSQVNEFDLITSGGTAFGGSGDYYSRSSDLLNNANGKEGLLSCWVRLTGGDGQHMFVLQSTGTHLLFYRNIFNQWEMRGRDTDSNIDLRLISSPTYTVESTNGAWSHILISWDLAAGAAHLYVDDVDVENSGVTIKNDDVLDYTQSAWGVGALGASGANKLNGVTAYLSLSLEYLDITVEGNRRKFRSGAGRPVDLGINGEIPTTNVPIIYLPKGDATGNRGYGGQFTTVGHPVPTLGPNTSYFDIHIDGETGIGAESAPHDNTELDSEFWIGSSPAGLGYLRAMGALSNIELIQRVMPAEEILARR